MLRDASIVYFCFAVLCGFAPLSAAESMVVVLDPVTRCFEIRYTVPKSAPARVTVNCMWSPPGKDDWRIAPVTPLVSESALHLADADLWSQWMRQGKVTEQRAAGLTRSVIFNPYPDAQPDGRVAVDFRVEIQTSDGTRLSSQIASITADNSDVIYIEDWTKVYQHAAVKEQANGARSWEYRSSADPDEKPTFGKALYGEYSKDVSLPQLSFPLGLKGWYALFVKGTPRIGAINLRLTGDERSEQVSSRKWGEEVLWQWRKLDRQQLVLKQPHSFSGYSTGHLDYVKMVPLTAELVAKLNAPYEHRADRFVAGYWEPYSWAFIENVQVPAQHREPLIGFQSGGVDLIDIQLGRFGSKANYESQVIEQIIGTTFGDPIDGNNRPTTDGVAKMQHFTNLLQSELQYARELGLNAHANFGAAAAYHDTEIEERFSKEHREGLRGDALKYEIPEVRQYVLSIIRETLEIGAPAVSIDFCRYPECIDSAETCTVFLRELKQLRDEFARSRKAKVPLLVRFPAKNVRLWNYFDYETWIQEGLIDYLCPSNIQARHHHFAIEPYVAAVKGKQVKLLPVIDGLYWGLDFPGPILWRVRQLFDAGVDGVYMYQADNRLLNTRITDRRTFRFLKSTSAVKDFWRRDAEQRPRASKGIYLSYAELGDRKYHSYERARAWLEGIPLSDVEMLLDGKPYAKYSSPPYILGTEEYDSDRAMGDGPHQLQIRAKDGDGWLEQEFAIESVFP